MTATAILAASGVYAIRNTTNGKVYVGSACCFERRFYEHKKRLNGGRHHSIKLQNAWDKYGEKCFVFEILEYVEDKNLLLQAEQKWFSVFSPHTKNGYNILPTAGSRLGSKRTEQQVSHLAKMLAGKKQSAEHIAKRVAKNTGKKRNEEQKKRLADALEISRKKYPEKFASVCIGRVLSEETKQKIREKAIGRLVSDETRRKMSEARYKNIENQRISCV